ncbi:MAG: ABC transporter ATP-binding protein [SAR324 cluster bacterium]|nr:ABC transporter ATP-binding protein [SAR324 cluster bacterium]MEE1575566.1 ABC transporter ATP-binding protein [Deltaproteobacteria bacterium]
MSDSDLLLSMRGVCKSFGVVQANQQVDLLLKAGDILGLLGENGAGKTTLMNILFGTYQADQGSISIQGQPVEIHSSADALELGVGMVHQHFHLVPRHTVLENLMLGRPGKGGRLDQTGARDRLEEIGKHYGLKLNPDAIVSELTIGEQQRLEIIKALFRKAKILILDEPTAVLTPKESEGLFSALRALADGGMGIIFITHKLYEVREVTNRVVVMRGGAVTSVVEDPRAVTEGSLAQMMCGHELTPPEKTTSQLRDPLLKLSGISTRIPNRPFLKDVDMVVHGGEILGIAGVSGNGQRELADVIAGILPPSEGKIEVKGNTITQSSPRKMQKLKIGRIPEDRMTTGLVTTLPLFSSMVLPWINHPNFSRLGILRLKAIREFTEAMISRFGIRAIGPEVRTGTLSGGNLQKALLARELAFDPEVLLASQPTRGLDVAAADFVHRKFLELREAGAAIILISEDLEELFTLSDRIMVMYEGCVHGEQSIADASVEKIGLMMAGAEAA